MAETVVELDAVEDAGAVLQAEDVLSLQVTVAVPHGPERNAVLEQPVPPGEIAVHELLDPGAGLRVEDRPDEGGELFEVGVPVGLHGRAPPGGVDLRRGRRRCVEDRHPAGDLAEDVLERPAGPDQGRQAALRRHAAHDDEMVAGRAVGPGDVGDAQVDVGGQPAVQLHLPLAGPFPGLPGGEVEEPEGNRLFELVDTVPDGDENGDVRFGDARRQPLTDREAFDHAAGPGVASPSARTSCWPLQRVGS